MENGTDFGKNKGPYHGVFIVVIIMLGIPVVLYYLFNSLLGTYQHYSTKITSSEAQAFAGAIGTAFCIAIIATGGLTKAIQVVMKRLGEFFTSLIYENISHAFRWYFQDIREHGLVLWIYLAVILANLWFFLDGLSTFLALTGV